MATIVKTIKASGGDYTSLSAWEAGRQADIDAAGNIEQAVCYAIDDTTAVVIDGWTTSAADYIDIITDPTGRHAGKWDGDKYNLIVGDEDVLSIYEDYVRVDGLQVKTGVPGGHGKSAITVALTTATNNDIRISNTILVGHGNASYAQRLLELGDSDIKISIYNVIGYGVTTGGSNYVLYCNCATAAVYSFTGIGGEYGVYVAAGTVTAKNCYFGGSGAEDYYRAAGALAKTNCASEDQSADDTGTGETATNCVAGAIAVNTTNFTNVSAGAEDFHLPVGSALIGVGTDTTGDAAPMNFTTDIDGYTIKRWDIGADNAGTITNTRTIKSSGGDYSSLAAWEAGRQADIDAAGNIEQAVCYAIDDTTAVVVDGWTTSAADYIHIITDPTGRHAGKWDDAKYNLITSDATALRINESFWTVDGLQIGVGGLTAAGRHGFQFGNSDVADYVGTLKNTIIKRVDGQAGAYLSHGVYHYFTGASRAGTFNVFGNIVYDFRDSGTNSFGIYLSDTGSMYAYNNTCCACDSGIRRYTANLIAINNLLYDCGLAAYGTFDAGTDYNATDDAAIGYTVTGSGNTHDRLSQTFSFVDSGNDDYHLASTDAGAIGYGLDLSATFTTDIDGETRPTGAGTWDIGADEYVSSGVTLTVADAAHAHTVENIALTQAHTLALADALHSHAADNISLTQAHLLALADTAHAHAAEGVLLTQVHLLAISDAVHLHAADNIDLLQAHLLVVQDAIHAHYADALDLSGTVLLVIQDAAHAQTAENVALTQAHLLAVADALHSHISDLIALTQAHQLAVQDAAHVQTTENIELSLALLLIVADAVHAQTTENLTLTQAHVLAVLDALHDHTAESFALTQAHVLAIQDALHALTSDQLTLSTIGAVIYTKIVDAVPRRRVWDAPLKGRVQKADPRDRIVDVDRRR